MLFLTFKRAISSSKAIEKSLLLTKFQVPVQSEMFLLAQVDCDLLNSTQGEFLADSTLSNLGLVVAKSLGTAENLLVPILVLNPSDNVITIRKRTVIGKFKPLSMDDNVLIIYTSDVVETRSKAQTISILTFWLTSTMSSGRLTS